VVFAAALSGCNNANTWDGSVPRPSLAEFQTSAYPILLRDCAFEACHGGPDRFFHIYGPGRTRLLPTSKPADPATNDEITRSYDRARSMLIGGTSVDDSLLLRKPLERSAGGQGHKGVDSWGRNVYRHRGDVSYLALVHWAQSQETGTGMLPPAQAAADAGGM
jgi:hypothetical protein